GRMILLNGMTLSFAPLLILMVLPLISLSLVSCAALKKKKEKKQPPTAPPPKKHLGTPVPRSTKPKTEPVPSPQPKPPLPEPPVPKEETTAPEITPAPSTTSLVPTTTAAPVPETPVPDEDFEETLPATSRNASSTGGSPVFDWEMCVDYTPDVIIQHEFLFQLLERS
ncbi:hypothetical protein PMAYCL1PPCAC_29902, partial [Pristionchus mayeri]